MSLSGCGRVAHPSSRRRRLRDATAPAHRDLEDALAAAGYFASLDGYRGYLRRVAPLYRLLEGALDAAGAGRLLPDWARRRKADLALADLRALAPVGRPDEAPGPPLPARLPGPLPRHLASGEAGVWGALYVLEGATLGGASIARQVMRVGVAGKRGGRLIDPYGPDRGPMWRAFVERLEAADYDTGGEAALCPSAEATFALFAAALVPRPRPGAEP